MKNKNFGFTLIELLVVIVIIGILATISTATFKSYFGKARDAERVSAVQNMALMVKVDGAAKWDVSKFIYNAAGLGTLFTANDFRVPKGTNGICYLMAMAAPNGVGAPSVGDGNQFAVVTWGESTSTVATGLPGPIVDGTSAYTDALKVVTSAAPLVVNTFASSDFDCTALTFTNVKARAGSVSIAGYAAAGRTYLTINASGVIN